MTRYPTPWERCTVANCNFSQGPHEHRQTGPYTADARVATGTTRLTAFCERLTDEMLDAYWANAASGGTTMKRAARAVAERMVRDFALDYHYGEGRQRAEMAAWMDEPEPMEKP